MVLGSHQNFAATSASVDLAFLGDIDNGHPERLDPEVACYLGQSQEELPCSEVLLGGGSQGKLSVGRRKYAVTSKKSHSGAMRRTRSIKLSLQASKELAQTILALDDALEAVETRSSVVNESTSMSDPWLLQSPPFRY